MRRRKHEFSSYLVYESGKNWAEADADTAEAIDFLEFYAREMIRLSETSIHQPLVNIEGEDNQISYIPLGVGIVISPFNFPLAIMAGTTVATIVSGNTVILKPADATPVIAAKFVELMEEVGLPSGVLNYLPGDGIDVGSIWLSIQALGLSLLQDHGLWAVVYMNGLQRFSQANYG